MLFNSLQFLIFFPIVTTLFFLLAHPRRWQLLLFASCVFYMAFIPVYIFILLVTILIDYFAGIWIEETSGSKKKFFLVISIISTCLVLFIFKYFNFFNTNFKALADLTGWNYPVPALKIILPIGLSFHTFQSLSYVIEVYRGKQKAERHFGIYALYVMFYPQLVAGPIERPQNLLHQFHSEHQFEYQDVTDGLKLMTWGLFKKVVIADRLAFFVNDAFNQPSQYTGITFLVMTFFFAYQIYCDFSGYSDIAIGSAQVMGFKLMTNFNRPYYARSVAEFWKRWHISLSTWFKDYLYIPLGGNRVSAWRQSLNLFITFLVSGLWHGSSWTFVIWGALNGMYLVVGIWTQSFRTKIVKAVGLSHFPRLHQIIRVFITFSLICFSWIFFRANTLQDALLIISRLSTGVPEFFVNVLGHLDSVGGGKRILAPILMGHEKYEFIVALGGIVFLETMHFIQRKGSVRKMISARPVWVRWPIYFCVVYGILVFGAFQAGADFIYFQF